MYISANILGLGFRGVGLVVMFSAKTDSHVQFSLSHVLIHSHTHFGSSQGKHGHIQVLCLATVSRSTTRVSPTKLVGNVYVNTFTSWFRALRSCSQPRSASCSQVPTSELLMLLASVSAGNIRFNWVDFISLLVISCNILQFHSTFVCGQWSIPQGIWALELPSGAQAANGPCPVEAIGHYPSARF